MLQRLLKTKSGSNEPLFVLQSVCSILVPHNGVVISRSEIRTASILPLHKPRCDIFFPHHIAGILFIFLVVHSIHARFTLILHFILLSDMKKGWFRQPFCFYSAEESAASEDAAPPIRSSIHARFTLILHFILLSDMKKGWFRQPFCFYSAEESAASEDAAPPIRSSSDGAAASSPRTSTMVSSS